MAFMLRLGRVIINAKATLPFETRLFLSLRPVINKQMIITFLLVRQKETEADIGVRCIYLRALSAFTSVCHLVDSVSSFEVQILEKKVSTICAVMPYDTQAHAGQSNLSNVFTNISCCLLKILRSSASALAEKLTLGKRLLPFQP